MNKISLSILISIILTVILVSLVNVGLSLFWETPEYNDYCDIERPQQLDKNADMQDGVCTEDVKLCSDGSSVSRQPYLNCEFPVCDNEYKECEEDYDEARDNFNQKRFYVFALIGFTFLLIGLFNKEILIQITGLASGGILVFQGIVTNFENKIVTFVALLLILIIFGILAYRIVNKE